MRLFPVAHVVFPLLGIAFIGAAVGFEVCCYSRAQKYQRAFAAYQARRRGVPPRQFP